MFESVRPDPGREGLTKAARIFFVLAVLCVIVAVLEFAIAVAGREVPPLRSVATNVVLALAAVTIGNGIERQRPWAKWLGFAVAALELLNGDRHRPDRLPLSRQQSRPALSTGASTRTRRAA